MEDKNTMHLYKGNAVTMEQVLQQKVQEKLVNEYNKLIDELKKEKPEVILERAFGENYTIENYTIENYTIENIKRRVLEENSTRIPFIDAYKFKKPKLNNYKRNEISNFKL